MGVGQGEEEHKTYNNSRKLWILLGHLFSLSLRPTHPSLPPSPLLRVPTHVMREGLAGLAWYSRTAPRSALDSAQRGKCSTQRVKPATRPANHQQSRSLLQPSACPSFSASGRRGWEPKGTN